ncbi:signal peptidase-like protein I, partial [Calycina marina]
HPFYLFTAVLKTGFVFHVLTEFGYTIVPTMGASMLPTVEIYGDSLLVSKLYRRGRGVKVGDVVSFAGVHEPETEAVKRVLGMEGDYVLRNSPGAKHDDMIQAGRQVPQGHCWVVGDNLEYSRDSRHFGPIPLALIKGKIVAKVLPWGERKWMENNL